MNAGCALGEGPTCHTSGDLLWVDIPAGQLYRWDRGSAPVTTNIGESVSAVAETLDGSLVVATKSGLVHVSDDGALDLVAPLPRASDTIRMNDGKVDPAHRFVGGTMSIDEPHDPVGSLWSFGGGEAVELIGDVSISNGLGWDADGTTMYFIDTPTYRLDAFDYDVTSGDVSNRRTVVTIDARHGVPDGLCVDDEGGVWVALWGGGAVHRYVASELVTVVDIPTPYVTCPTFAGSALDEIVVTTASEPYGRHRPAGAGDLYSATPGVTGQAPHLLDLANLRRVDPEPVGST